MMRLNALLESLILLLEASLGAGEGLADERHEDAAEGLALLPTATSPAPCRMCGFHSG